ncbi:CDP-diacylglycerol--glycerol-3-phosphate 3-phosphatidyltransferase [Aeromicrobium sp.]|uniref:CDP-diacylglycerol--glycerol-3-phosphate 3-phosphatidyltransferase n=1 Tax=Aeromicrobium sp. TaxID=1871063 RepID=UPI003C614EC6
MTTAEAPSNFNIANALTVLRILGVPVFGWLLLTEDGQSVGYRIAAWATFGLLMITDKIDGDLARKHNLVTNFGKLADPIADKALTGMAFVGIAIIHPIFWPVAIIILVREWGITLMRFVVKKHGVMPASQGGKLKTTLQAVAIAGYLLPFDLWNNAPSDWKDTPSDIMIWVTNVLMAAALLVTLGTAVQYVRDAIELRRASKAAPQS